MKTNDKIESLQRQVLELANHTRLLQRRLDYNQVPQPPPCDPGTLLWFGSQQVRIVECSRTIAKVQILPNPDAIRWASDPDKFLLVEIEMLSKERHK